MKRAANLLVVVVALLATAASGAKSESGVTRLRRAPAFVLNDWQGDKVSLADFRGRIVLLQFFQTQCPICKHEAPLLEELYRKFKDQGVAVMGVSHDPGGVAALKQFAKQFDVTYFLLAGNLEIAVRYLGITPQQSSFDVPRFFLIDHEGYIVKDIDPAHDVEFIRDEKGVLTKAIEEALNSRPPARPPDPAPSR